jgi:acyl-ACP thioesterase
MNKLIKNILPPCYDFDLNMAIKPSAILNYFQDIAAEHAEKLNVGKTKLSPNGLFWILSKVKVNFLNDFKFGENIILITAPRPKGKIIFERDYQIKNELNVILADGMSKWCLIDKNTKKIIPSNNINYPIIKYENIPATSDIELFSIDLNFDFCYSYTPKYSDLDFNGHVNNAKYADFIFNAIDFNEICRKKIKSFQINYIKECFIDQLLNFYKHKNNNTYIILGKNQKNEIKLSAKIEFNDI